MKEIQQCYLLRKLYSSEKLDNYKVTISYRKYTWIAKKINWLCDFLSSIWPRRLFLHVAFFRNGILWKHSIMHPKVKQINLWNQAINCKLVWSYKTGIERSHYHQHQSDPYVFYIKNSVILTFVDYCLIVSHKQDTITSLIESLNNFPENYVLID